MLKKDMEEKLKEYEEIFSELLRWCFPIQYKIDRNKAFFHINGVIKVLEEKYIKGEY